MQNNRLDLLSLKLPKQQRITRIDDVNKIKSKIAVMFVQAAQCLGMNKFHAAKQLYIQITDSCSCIENPDMQVKWWIQTSFVSIGRIYQQENSSCIELVSGSFDQCLAPTILKYNKIQNKFQIDDDKIDMRNQTILYYISKINYLCFDNKYRNYSNSLAIMFYTYWFPFLMVFLLLIVCFGFLANYKILGEISQKIFHSGIAQIVLGGLCAFSMLLIFVKSNNEKSNKIFQQKLKKCVDSINLQRQQIKFTILEKVIKQEQTFQMQQMSNLQQNQAKMQDLRLQIFDRINEINSRSNIN